MVSVTIRDREMRPGERAHIRGEMSFGYAETLNPADVELKTIETVLFTPKFTCSAGSAPGTIVWPAGSIANPGNIGNTANIGWLDKSGSLEAGSRTAYFDIVGG